MEDRGFTLGGVHHLRLTVSDPRRSAAFYTDLLGFRVLMEFGTTVIVGTEGFFMGLGPAPDPTRSEAGEPFDENRPGLDHLSFRVGSRDELEAARRRFAAAGVPHGEVTDLGPELGLYILSFRDPDNIQLELTATH